MTAPTVSTCAPWATATHDVIPQEIDFKGSILANALQYASDTLYRFTDYQWPGECQETVRPVGCNCRGYGPAMYGASMQSVVGAGSRWFASGYAAGLLDSGHSNVSEVRLPGYPLVSIEEVKIDGAVIAAARYRIDNHSTLVYVPESTSATRQSWPCCQDMELADTELDTWSVNYKYGTAPPVGGVMACARLGFELALAMDPDADPTRCRLPQRLTQLTRGGQTIAMMDPMDLFDNQKTGLPEVDLWVSSTKKEHNPTPATVFVPGKTEAARRTNT